MLMLFFLERLIRLAGKKKLVYDFVPVNFVNSLVL